MCRRIPRTLWALLLAAAVLAAAPAFAGPAGQLVGHVTDEEGNAIAGARLTLTGSGTAGVQTTVSGADGLYRLTAFDAVESLDLLVEADGKIAVEYRELRVRPSGLTHLDVRLRGSGTPEILVLLDSRVPYHMLALEGARSVLHGPLHLVDVTKATSSWRHDLLRALDQSPSAVLAIGESAAQIARSYVRDLPVVHCMVPDPSKAELAVGNLCGVPLHWAFERQIERLQQLDPAVRRIGTIYDPSRLSDAVIRFRRVAAAAGLTLVAGQVHGTDDFPRALDDLAREDPDAFVVLLDPEIYTASNFAMVRRFVEEGDRILIVPDPSLAVAAKSFTLGPGFFESGAVAAGFVKQIVEGRLSPQDIGLCETAVPGAAAASRGTPSRSSLENVGEPPLVGSFFPYVDPEDGSRQR